VNVRLIAATNKNLDHALDSGAFRTDLYYRLSVFPIFVPPLRERHGDIPLLAEHFVRHYAERVHKPAEMLSDAALDRLLDYHWPGNVRELQNIIERAVILSTGPVVGPDAFSVRRSPAPARRASESYRRVPLDAAPLSLDEAERRAIVRACAMTGWRISGPHGAAGLLGLKPTTLHAKMKRLGIHRPLAATHDPTANRPRKRPPEPSPTATRADCSGPGGRERRAHAARFSAGAPAAAAAWAIAGRGRRKSR
jgi:transcriptional regulator with GAF, ATPase, and Fis domain